MLTDVDSDVVHTRESPPTEADAQTTRSLRLLTAPLLTPLRATILGEHGALFVMADPRAMSSA